ncbi:MAG: hypothetical protein MZU97_20175 [Bacillus subtilis]|nr:hypothetical protein [Bacillus subtilis]
MADDTLTSIDRLLEADLNQQALTQIDARPEHLHLISRRIFALVGLGRIEEANRYLQENEARYNEAGKLDQAAFLLARAAVLHASNRVSEALIRYEEALVPIRHSRSRLFLRGRIWRELALAEFGDFNSVANLKRCVDLAKQRNDAYLTALATTFWLLAKRRFQQAFDDADRLLANAISYPGLRLQAVHAVDGTTSQESQFALIEGMKGLPWMLAEKAPAVWKDMYLTSLLSLREKAFADLFSHLPDTPLMKTMACANCDNRCCYDGVYVTAKEEQAIAKLRKKYPAYFKDVPKVYLEEGEWGFLFQGKRTKLRAHEYSKPDYPKHFGKTKCVLALPNGECAPQRAGADHLYHPWRFKPEICWKFPLIGLFNDNAMEKPHYFGEPDPHYFDENQPGYLAFLPCATVDQNGVSWKRVYQHELQHFYLQNK